MKYIKIAIGFFVMLVFVSCGISVKYEKSSEGVKKTAMFCKPVGL